MALRVEKIQIKDDKGMLVDAQAPVIISASRSTDIPAFYADWFKTRWERGYIKWKNPFNGKPSYVSFKNTHAVVFWTKNPKPMLLKHIDFLKQEIKNFYFQYSLNDYEQEGYEGNVPKLETRIQSFIDLSKAIGKERVIWRFDPLILTDSITVDELLQRVKNIGDQLKDYTEKFVFSYADISIYRKVAANLKKANIAYREFTSDDMHAFAKGLQELNKQWRFEIGTCGEKINLDAYGIVHNKCIDDDLMEKLFWQDSELMEYLGKEPKAKSLSLDLFGEEEETPTQQKERKKGSRKDKGQRELCGCMVSKDIGQYNTCPHECVYCYANDSIKVARINYDRHKANRNADTIIGE